MTSSRSADREVRRCPACDTGQLRHFLQQCRIPVHATQLLTTAAEASAYPTGDVRLAFCSRCAFITNTAHDHTRLDYSGHHEESQAFSPRFRTFARDLARRWIERYDLRGKRVLEIGCGKGDFLAMMVEEGIREGLGVDPAAGPGRITGPAAAHIEWVRDYFTPGLGRWAPEAIVCRHTLEHIRPVRRFIEDVRAGIGGRRETVVLFELPDALRVLRETAFWDIYYEHCSYFTPGSIGRLFRGCGFDIRDLWLAYEGQYLIIEAFPRDVEQPATAPLPIEEEVALVADAVAKFERRYAHRMATWRRRLQEARDRGWRSVIWGGGSKGLSFLTALRDLDTVQYVVDVNPNLQGRYMAGIARRVVAPEFLVEYRPDLVVVMNRIYLEEIGATLHRLGLSPTLLAV